MSTADTLPLRSPMQPRRRQRAAPVALAVALAVAVAVLALARSSRSFLRLPQDGRLLRAPQPLQATVLRDARNGRLVKLGRRAADPAAPAVFVVDGHGDALQHWLHTAGAGSEYAVLHIDSHADMFLDFQPTSQASSDADAAFATLEGQCHLSNFMPLGILAGKVDRVVWLRSDFSDCRYNGPPPGEYDMTLGQPDLDFQGPALTYWQRGGGSFREYSFLEDPLNGGHEEIGKPREEWPPKEQNLWWEKVPYLLDEWGLYQLGEPMGTQFAPPRPDVAKDFRFSVIADSQLQGDDAQSLDFLRNSLASKGGADKWILDIDLDFFSTLAPALAPIVRRLQLPQEQANRLGYWGQELAVTVQAIEEEDPGCQAFRLPLLLQTMEMLSQGAEGASAETIHDTIREVDPGCSIDSEAAERMANVLKTLSEKDLAVWAALTPEECDAVVQSPHGPHFIASREAVQESVKKLEKLLAALPPPSAVTVARSTDLYMPLDLGPFIEEEVLTMLSRLGWAGASEAGGEVHLGAPLPAWPENEAVPA
eukprot:TRINITY_DN57906_c0_g1_i1.p1 TRINITY_DN57906_c0_g1~~TRINITY_DN57906_c0_g1_i1.p1  ORF type:complete len:570 (-),score=112.04 TRINITY_DN57906_c0_g1_i1:26-1636(-)